MQHTQIKNGTKKTIVVNKKKNIYDITRGGCMIQKKIQGLSVYNLIVILIIMCVLGNFLLWRKYSVMNYSTRYIRRGMKYRVGHKYYQIPDIPVSGNTMLLDESFLVKQREILKDTLNVLMEQNIECWLSGGTLLGFQRHGTIMPWDDDCDIHTDISNRDIIGTDSFQSILQRYGLERIKLVGCTSKWATGVFASLRIRRIGTHMPVCDIFFTHNRGGHVTKIDGWFNTTSYTYNKREHWNHGDIYPIQYKVIDDILVPIPNNPQEVLMAQYGRSVLQSIVCRTEWFAHAYPMLMFPFMQTRTRLD
jgi:hypothetical protein